MPCAPAQLSHPSLLCPSVWHNSAPDQQPPSPQQVQDVLKQTSKQLGTDLSISGFVRVQVRLPACCSLQLVVAATWAVPAAPVSCGASFASLLGCPCPFAEVPPLAHSIRAPCRLARAWKQRPRTLRPKWQSWLGSSNPLVAAASHGGCVSEAWPPQVPTNATQQCTLQRESLPAELAHHTVNCAC